MPGDPWCPCVFQSEVPYETLAALNMWARFVNWWPAHMALPDFTRVRASAVWSRIFQRCDFGNLLKLLGLHFGFLVCKETRSTRILVEFSRFLIVFAEQDERSRMDFFQKKKKKVQAYILFTSCGTKHWYQNKTKIKIKSFDSLSCSKPALPSSEWVTSKVAFRVVCVSVWSWNRIPECKYTNCHLSRGPEVTVLGWPEPLLVDFRGWGLAPQHPAHSLLANT